MKELSLGLLKSGCTGAHTAIRMSVVLEPAGGQMEKIFPPVYPSEDEGRARTTRQARTYAIEDRIVGDQNGEVMTTVLLDSVQSQANRMEQALLKALGRGECRLPVVSVDFGSRGVITVFDAPHRIFDAIFRDSLLDGTPFFESPVGSKLCSSSQKNATGLFRYCPTVLVFGGWNSHSRGGASAAKIPRAIVSEIVGIIAARGLTTYSRIDPLGIIKEAGRAVDMRSDGRGGWIIPQQDADKKAKRVNPSDVGHGNIAPGIDRDAGGVSIREAKHLAVLSFRQLCNLHFPGEDGKIDDERDVAGRAVLAALGLYALTLQLLEGYQLRSRCLLVPKSEPAFELVGVTASDVEPLSVDVKTASAILGEALQEAKAVGLSWEETPLVLRPSEKLRVLVEKSDELWATVGAEVEGED